MMMINRVLINLPLLVKLSETEKKVLIILAVVFAFVFVIVGLIVKAIRSWMKEQSKHIDFYLYDLCKYRVLKTPNEVVKYVYRRETKTLYLKIRWSLRIFILAAIGFIIYFEYAVGTDFNRALTIVTDLLVKLEWPTSTFFGIKMVSGWPTIIKSPVVYLDLTGYITYVMLIITLWMVINLFIQTLGFVSKQRRARKVSVSAFGRSLDPEERNNE